MSWSIQLPTGATLNDVPTLALELNNQVFTASAGNALPGSFTFPATVRLTPANRAALGFPDLPGSLDVPESIPGCTVLAAGVPLFYGTLYIISATTTQAQISIVSRPLEGLREKMIGEIDLGGDRPVPSPLIAHMTDTAHYPDDYDYAFFPVRIPAVSEVPDNPGAYHNYYQYFTPIHSFSPDAYAFTPYVRLDYLLSRINSANTGEFTFTSALNDQADPELRRLYIYNNRDMRVSDTPDDPPTLPATFRLNDHLPAISVGEALLDIATLFNCGIFTNLFDRTVQLIPLRNLLRTPARYDWTQYLNGPVTIERNINAPTLYNYSDIDSPPASATPVHSARAFRNYAEANAAWQAANWTEWYWLEDTCRIYRPDYSSVSTLRSKESYRVFRGVKLSDTEKDYNTRYKPIYSTYGALFSAMYHNLDGVSRYELNTETGEYQYKAVPYSFSLMLYRGLNNWDNPFQFPQACNQVWDGFTNPPVQIPVVDSDTGTTVYMSQLSLLWNGEYGLYERYHREWSERMLYGKQVTASFVLPLAEIISFQFQYKVRMESMDYWIARIRVQQVYPNGYARVEALMYASV